MAITVDNSKGSSLIHVDSIVQPDGTLNTETSGGPLERDETPYGKVVEVEYPKGEREYEGTRGEIIRNEPPDMSRSMFSNYHTIRIVQQNGSNYPMFESDVPNNQHLYKNVTAKELLASKDGALLFKKEDLLYAKHYGSIPNNKMIVLRRFAMPVFDDITSKYQSEPDVARVVGFIDGEKNRIQDIIKFSAGLNFREQVSEILENQMMGDPNGINGWMGKVMKYVDPKFGLEAARGQNALNYNPYHDHNKVYGPVDSINKVFIRDVGIKHEHKFDLVFEFEARSYDGISPKAATIDWISNILVIATVDAQFWGGARYWTGPRPTKFLNDLKFLAPRDFNDFLNKSHISFKGFLGSSTGGEGGGAGAALKILKNVATNALNLKLGAILDKVGRPSIPMITSLLNGTPLGTWHVSVGNPFNPIISLGNLICEGVDIAPSDDSEFSFDDFPTKWTATFKLDHQQPRDRAALERMLNNGKTRTYFKPKDVIERQTKRNPKKGNNVDVWKLAEMASTSTFGKYTKADVERNLQDLFKFF